MRKYTLVLLLCLSLLHVSACTPKTITCEDGYENVDGQCEWIRTAFEQKLDNTEALKDYPLAITVTLGEETTLLTIKFDDLKSEVSVGMFMSILVKKLGRFNTIHKRGYLT